MRIIERNKEKLVALCQAHKVKHLFVFGSVITPQFNKYSDIDFVVDFEDIDLYNYADNYYDLKASLENLFKREVDLLEDKAIRNPFFRKSVDSSKLLIYG